MTDLETLNDLFNDWDVAVQGAATAQKDVVVILREHLHGVEDFPPATMQTVANDLWEEATKKRALLEDFFNQLQAQKSS